MDTEARLKQVMDVLDQIAEDTSVPPLDYRRSRPPKPVTRYEGCRARSANRGSFCSRLNAENRLLSWDARGRTFSLPFNSDPELPTSAGREHNIVAEHSKDED